MKKLLSLLLATAALGGCATRHEMRFVRPDFEAVGLADKVQARQLERQLERETTDEEIAKLLDVEVSAKLPTTVAVARVQSQCWGRPFLDHMSVQELADWEKAIQMDGLIQGVEPISAVVLGEERPTLQSLRVAAARLNCELLLVYLQSDATVDNFNDAAVLYWTIAGLWIVPGSVMEQKTVMQAVLVDCRTGMILGTASGDNQQRKLYAHAFQETRRAELQREVPQAALKDLMTASRAMVRRVAAASGRAATQPT